MASNKTANYGLSQWKKTDPVRMEDFNADNRKLDAAIAAAAVSPCCVTGTYTGNNETVEVNVGFRPSFLVILCGRPGSAYNADIMGLMGVSRYMVTIHRNSLNTIDSSCTFTDTGFSISDPSKYGMNYADYTYTYIAFY